MKAVFLRVIEAEDKATTLRRAIEESASTVRFERHSESFRTIPRSPFAYWVSDRVRRLFRELPKFDQKSLATSGTGTLNDFRFLRLRWEGNQQRSWFPYAKGGAYALYYFDQHLLVNWAKDGREMKAWIVERYGGGHWARNIRSTEHYFRPGLTWPRRTQLGLSIRAMAAGSIFADKGPAAFVDGDPPAELLALLAVMNSRPFRALVELQMAFGSYEVGVLQRTPVPGLEGSERGHLAALAGQAWSLKRRLDTRTETSHAFVLPALLQVEGASLAARAQGWSGKVADVEGEVACIQREIDDRCFQLYGIEGEDRRQIEGGFGAAPAEGALDPDDNDDEIESEEVDPCELVTSLLSWSVGVAFGRFDLRLATGERQAPPEPEPFDPLPPCSPGMLTGDDGLPLDAPPPGYLVDFPGDGVLVDDVGHGRDLVARALQAIDFAFAEGGDAAWREAAEILEAPGGDLRPWFARSFFDDHVKRYSKSRRKAPIYWQLATPSASYSVWLYYHRFTRDTLYRALNDSVAPKLEHEERKLTTLTQEAGRNPAAGQRKEIDAQERFVQELRAFRDEVARVAPLWNPDLNDGVIINFAPLWRLVPQSRSWQKECKACWDKLVAGDYDWSHLAMHLWPERVVPRCAEDRSLAIAHGLEEVFWEENADGKWHPKKVSRETVEQLVEERTSAAVKAALEGLLRAPAPAGRRTRKGGG